ncbi:MAG TPA: GreA/GreB family elongation factor [Candidatus Binataceae bacterium]|nr:GreA/GreB family elongation factor [Candidatus Binataceae bacterium]
MAELPVIKRLRKEMATLKRELTVDLPKELERARAHGDLSENAEWAMAKQRQEFLRIRLSNLEARVAELTMINLDSIPRETVGLGSRVMLEDLDEGGELEFEIVVPEEVDGAQNRISLSSPLGRSLIGKAEEDEIEVVTPKGKRSYLVRRLVTIHAILATESDADDGEAGRS